MTVAESRMSRSRPCCFSLSINGDGRGEDGTAAVGIAAAFHRRTTEQIDGMPELFFEILLQATHLQQSRIRLGKKFDQEIKIALAVRLTTGTRAKQLHSRDRVALTDRANDHAETRQIEWCWR